MPKGTLSTLDDLNAFTGVVSDFGEDATFDAVQATLDAHNAVVQEMFTDFVEDSEDPIRRYGGSANEDPMDELDEHAISAPRKYVGGTNVGFPLRNYGASLQWTRKFFQNATTRDFATQVKNILVSDVKTLRREIARALFKPTNMNFVDRLESKHAGLILPVKALLNADGSVIPSGPNGQTFDGTTHTHYLGVAVANSPAASDVDALIDTVIEHYPTGMAILNINRAQEAFIRSLPEFVGYIDPRIHLANTQSYGAAPLDVIQVYNRAIGIFRGAEVWVRPWVPVNYGHAWLRDQMPPLVKRRRAGGSGALELMYEDEDHPLRAKTWEREFGIGVWERTNGACMYFGGTVYQAPVIN